MELKPQTPIRATHPDVGFTGTRLGMTFSQKSTLRNLLRIESQRIILPVQLHHGDCVGADAQANEIARDLGMITISHPPVNESKRAFCYATGTLPQAEYLVRNRAIVDESSLLIASPAEVCEQSAGGTWYTVRYARRRSRQIMIIWPDGGCSVEKDSDSDEVGC